MGKGTGRAGIGTASANSSNGIIRGGNFWERQRIAGSV